MPFLAEAAVLIKPLIIPGEFRRATEAGIGKANLGQTGTKAGKTFGTSFGSGFKSMFAGAGIFGGIFAASAAIKSAAAFQQSMRQIQTQAGGTAKDVALLSQQVLAMGGKAQQGPQVLSEALFHLKSVGMDNVEAMKALKASSDLAAVGQANMEATTNALAGAWRSGVRGAQNFGEAAATVNAIIGAGNIHMDQFVQAIGTGILPAARTFGLSLRQVGAALALMTDEGIPAQSAAYRLRQTFALMGAPSGTAAKALAGIGLKATELADIMRSPAGLIGALQDFQKHVKLSGLTASEEAQVIVHAFGGGRSSAAIMTLLNNLSVLQFKQEQINRTLKNYGADVKAQSETAGAAFDQLKSSVQTLGIEVGTVLLPPLAFLARAFVSTSRPATLLRDALLYGAMAFIGWKVVFTVARGVLALRTAMILAATAAQAYTAKEILAEAATLKLGKATTLAALGMRGILTALGAVGATAAGSAAGIALVAGGAVALGLYLRRYAVPSFQQWNDQQEKAAEKAGFLSKKWADYVGQLHNMQAAESGLTRAQAEQNAGVVAVARNWQAHEDRVKAISAAYQAASLKTRNYLANLKLIQTAFQISQPEAVKLAQAAGITADQLARGGKAAKDAVQKVYDYGDANRAAHQPTHKFSDDLQTVADKAQSARDRVKALTDAYDAFINPQVSADQAAVSMANDLKDLASALKDSHGAIGLQTKAQIASFGSWNTSITDAEALAKEVANGDDVHHRYRNYLVNTVIPALKAAAGGDKDRRKEIDKLAESIRNLPNEKDPHIKVTASGKWDRHMLTEFPWLAGAAGRGRTGTRVPGFGGGDRHPYLLEGGEAVVSKETTRAHAAELRSWGVPGMQLGGVAGITGYQPEMVRPDYVKDEVDVASTVAKIQAMIMKRILAGGGGAAIVKSAMQWIGRIPYVWGGTDVPGGADCSGFTQNIYGRHGIIAPRTAAEQAGWVRRGSPTPGGLMFAHGPSAGGVGHVAIVGYGGKMISQGGPGKGPQLVSMSGYFGAGVPPKGFARGQSGVFGGTAGESELSRLWISAGGPAGVAHLMAAIAMAESGGRANAVGPMTRYGQAKGLWQILGQVISGNIFDPFINAENAVAKWRTQGLAAWAAYTNGSYRRFYGRGTRGALPGWGVVGERGMELVNFFGGEQVIPAGAGGMMGRPGYAAGTLPKDFRGLTTKTDSLWSDIHRFLREIRDHFRQPEQRHLVRLAESQARDLAGLRREWRQRGATIAAARDYRQQVTQGLADYGTLGAINRGGAVIGGRFVSGGRYLETQLTGRLTRLRRFSAVLRRLDHEGASNAIMREVVALGPDQGIAYARDLLAGGRGLIRRVGHTEAAITAQERRIGRGAASAVYAGRYRTADDFVAGLRRHEHQLERMFDRLGNRLGREAARWLGSGRTRRFQAGGPITEPVIGVGQRSGSRYEFHANEQVTPNSDMAALHAAITKMHRDLIKVLAAAPGQTGSAVAEGLNQATTRAAYRAQYSVR